MEILKTKFGDVQLKRYASSRRIKLRILNKNTIQVTAPYAASQKAIHLFIAKNEHWIQQKINLLTQQMLISEGTNLALLDTLIEIDHQQKRDTSLFIPMDSQSSIEEQQDQIKHQINKIIRTTAKAYLPSRCLQLANHHDISIGQVRVKKVRSRWGSCSIKNNINLSMYLVLLDKPIIDYVIYHELAHVKHKNHSRLFWEYLQELCPNALALDRQLAKLKIPYQLYLY